MVLQTILPRSTWPSQMEVDAVLTTEVAQFTLLLYIFLPALI